MPPSVFNISHNQWIIHSVFLRINQHVSPSYLDFYLFISSHPGSDEPTSLHIQLSANANLTTSDLGQFWLLNRPEGLTFNESWSFSQETLDAGVVLQSIPGSQLLPGQQLIGRIGFSQRRVLERTFYTILGLSSVSLWKLACTVIQT